MKLTKLLEISIVATLLAGNVALASSSDCGFINNSDQRNSCIAQARRNPANCGFINNSDQRNLCIAQARQEKSQCGFINDSNLRNQCRGLINK